MRVLMIFLDGVGIGKRDPAVNPFFAAPLPALRSMFQGEWPSLHARNLSGRHATLLPLDATMGVAGLPQSGTGQTALFTGVNAPKIVGRHFGPHPYSTLRPVIESHNIFHTLLTDGKLACFANAFPQRFFDYIEQHKMRMTVTTLSCMMSGVPILHGHDLEQGRAVSADITGEGWRNLGYPGMPVIEPVEAGRRLVHLLGSNDFVLFEYWKTDPAGHSRDMRQALQSLERLDAMLMGVLETLDLRDSLLLMTSDHGNIEDMRVKTHTRNPVPLILYGHRHAEIAASFRGSRGHPASLMDVTPVIVQNIIGHA